MSVKILSRRSNYLERAIIFEVDGEIKNIAAPRDAKSFDDLLKQIESEYGAVDAPGTATQKKEATEPSEGVVEVVAEVVTEPTETPAEPETTAPTTAKKTSSKKKAKG